MMQETLHTPKPKLISPLDVNEVFALPTLVRSGQIYLISGHKAQVVPVVQELVHHFIARGDLRVIVGGNRFSLERLPLVLGENIGNLHKALQRVKISRGETCYQLLNALQKTPGANIPLVVMDMLDSFYEEDLTEGEVSRVLADSLKHLRRLSEHAPLLISASTHPGREQLLDELLNLAEYSIELWSEQIKNSTAQLSLI